MNDTVTPYGSSRIFGSLEDIESYLSEVAAFKQSATGHRLLVKKDAENLCGDRQAVHLDFSEGTTFRVRVTDHRTGTVYDITYTKTIVYTEEDKIDIKTSLENDFYGFAIDFFLEKPSFPDECISTLHFTCTTDDPCMSLVIRSDDSAFFNSILFGRAEGIDFLNLNRGDSAFVAIDLFEMINPANIGITGLDLKVATQMMVSNRCTRHAIGTW